MHSLRLDRNVTLSDESPFLLKDADSGLTISMVRDDVCKPTVHLKITGDHFKVILEAS